ncbi:MAG TPA: signal peptidase I [Opitutus sp.]|nr:signal peptidase I [Opitutus sp.]
MFGFFASQEKKARDNASNWLELAGKVWHFRRDQLSEKDATELRQRTGNLRQQLKSRAEAAKLKLGIEALEPVLRKTGGAIYPKTSLVENVEFFLVAAIVILGIRTYFVQPFKIPTNSMWPTYYGMTPEVFQKKAEEPGALAAAARFVALGAWPHRIDAPADGEILVPIGGRERHGYLHCRTVPGRKWLVLPTTLREYTLLVGDEPVTVKVPADFDFDWALYDAYFSDGERYNSQRFGEQLVNRLGNRQFVTATVDGEELRCIRTGHFVHKGDRMLSFDVLTGDQLFVDRISYNFVPPHVGSGFVFRTDHIRSEHMEDPVTGRQIEDYYIKRLVGVPGDTLEVKGTELFRNGAPIQGAAAFEANARRADKYPGYRADGSLAPGQTVHVPPDGFFAMGDNSPNSEDSRFWGFVPRKDAVGRPLFIYYPFTRRWGPAR